MKRRPPRSLARVLYKQRIVRSLGAGVSVLLLGGCFGEKRPAARVVDVSLRPPVLPAVASNSIADEPPEFPFEIMPMPQLEVGRTVPPRPRVAPAKANETAPAEKAEEPLMLPQLSAEEMAAAKAESQRSMETAEGNLARVASRTLNAAQKDLEAKVRSFLESAREAMQSGDLPRARNFAKKAEVLSQELTGSF